MSHGIRLSVIMPVLNGRSVLPRSLGALFASDLPRADWELIIVDDGSSDGTLEYAARFADRTVRVPSGPRGPAFARNRGAEVAKGDVLVFIDADVCVHEDALSRFAELFALDDSVTAAFGAYDDDPAIPGFMSQYRNLYHRYVHLKGAGDAETFWAGCGAVRRPDFLEAGGYDSKSYPRPQIEDIELGYRLVAAGHRIVLDPAIEVKHLKLWTLPDTLRTDLLHRGVPWTLLLLSGVPRAGGGKSLNIDPLEKVKTGLLGVACAAALLFLVVGDVAWAVGALVAVLLVVALNAPLYRWFADLRGWGFALRVVPLNLVYYMISGLSVALASILHVGARARKREAMPPLIGVAESWPK